MSTCLNKIGALRSHLFRERGHFTYQAKDEKLINMQAMEAPVLELGQMTKKGPL